MEAATNPNKTNTFPNILTLHIYKTILLFIFYFIFSKILQNSLFLISKVQIIYTKKNL